MRFAARAIAPFGGAVILALAVGCGAGAGTVAGNMPADPVVPTSSSPRPAAPPDTIPQESGGNGGTGATGTGGGGAGGGG